MPESDRVKISFWQTSRPRLLFLAAEGVRSDGDDRDQAQRRIGFNPACGGVTVHNRHLDIHQDKIRPLFRDSCQCLLTIFGRGDLIVCWGKHIVNDLALSGWSSTTKMRLLMLLQPAAQRSPAD